MKFYPKITLSSRNRVLKVEEAEILLLLNEEFIMTPYVNFAQSSQNLTMEQAETAG